MAFLSLRSTCDFDRVFKGGIRLHSGLGQMIIRIGSDKQRIGIVVGKKVGNAVIRNRIKRVIRESFRKLSDRVGSAEIVFIPTKRCAEAGVPWVFNEMKAALSKSGIYLNRTQ